MTFTLEANEPLPQNFVREAPVSESQNQNFEACSRCRDTLLILLLGTLARGCVILASPGIVWPDSLHYLKAADNLLRSQSWNHIPIFHTPGYPTFLALFLHISNDAAAGEWIIAVQHLLSLVTALFIYDATCSLSNARAGLIAALFFALSPLVLYLGNTIQTEIPYVFLLSVIVWSFTRLLCKLPYGSLFRALILGTSLGCAILVRPIALPFLPLIILILALSSHLSVQRRGAVIGTVLFSCVFALSPWLLFNAKERGFLGVSKGTGTNLFLRAFEIDNFTLPESSRFYPIYQRYRELKALHAGRQVYFQILHDRTRALGSEVRADNQLGRIAREAIFQNKISFLGSTLATAAALLVNPKKSVQWCNSKYGHSPVLCTSNRPEFKIRYFPETERQNGKIYKEVVRAGFLSYLTPQWVLSLLAFVGMTTLLRDVGPRSSPHFAIGVFFLLGVLGNCLATGLLNVAHDRYLISLYPLLVPPLAIGLARGVGRLGPAFRKYARNSISTFHR